MDTELAAQRLAELGHKTRLDIFRFLVKAGCNGAAVGEIQAELDVPGSTLSHHLARLVSVGLVEQVRQSQTLRCFPKCDALQEVVDFLVSECWRRRGQK